MATINDLITEARKTTNPVVTTVSTARSIGGTSLICTSLSGWPTNTAVHFITYKKTTAGLIDKSTQCDWKGIVSSNTIGTLTLKSGTDAGNSIGDFVEMGPTAAYAQDVAAALEVSHNVDGTMITGLPLTSPKVTTGINDSNNNELFKVVATASAVNEVTVTNAATGNAPQLSATGGDTNVSLNLVSKGTGSVQINGTSLANPVVQTVSSVTSAVATGTTTIPLDDTIPQNIEGDQYMTLAITPKVTTNILVIDATLSLANSAVVHLIAALFQDSTANALAAINQFQETAGGNRIVRVMHTMAAGTTSATTFKIRAGGSGAGTTTFNGAAGARLFGAITKSSIVITEYKA